MLKKIKKLFSIAPSKPKRLLLAACICLCLLFAAICFLFRPLPQGVLNYTASTSVYDASGGLLYAGLSANDEWCIPVSLDKMGKWTPIVAVGVEDKRFYKHGGVDYFAILRASYQNLRARRVISGASTITTQVIRIANPRPRTLLSKLTEFWGAWQLETKADKKRILELYLNRAPFGGNLRGIEAASRAYFNKPASGLSLGESTLLIGLVRAPARFRPDRYPTRAKNLRDVLLARLSANGLIPAEDSGKALLEPVKSARYPLPKHSLLAARRAMRENVSGTRINSSIDPALQFMLERSLEYMLSSLPEEITAAGIIVDNETRNVTAYVGNARFDSDLPGSQVDCADAPRSPGSTLKPFVYAASFEEGNRTPATLLADTPIAFQGNAPRNYDLTYRGPVSTRIALALSLNAPAVRVLREIGYGKVLNLYGRLGFSHIKKDASYYADSLVLGGCEVTLSQLAAAYATLAGGGNYAPLRWTEGTSPPKRKVFTAETSFLTTDILRDERRLVPLYRDIFGQEGQPVAFKTGTSYGTRDAWTAGSSNSQTVAIWFGDPSGKSHQELVGLELAAPAVLRVFRELKTTRDDVFLIPKKIIKRKVCALSGELPSEICPHLIEDYAIEDKSPQRVCRIHRLKDGEVVLTWPEELKQWSQMRDVALSDDVTSSDVSPDTEAGEKVRIIRPISNSVFSLPSGEEKLRLFVSAEGEGDYFWYLDGLFIHRGNKEDKQFIDVSPGKHKLSVLANEQSDSVSFEVLSLDEAKARAEQEPEILNK